MPVVERSVTIAGISTRELVLKDFATEPNEERMRKAGHLMAQKLAGSLALVTCKEPLKTNMMAHLRNFSNDFGFTESIVTDSWVNGIVADNLELACQAIERAAMDRAVIDVDDGFATAYEARRRHREQRPGQPFWDPSAPQSALAATLPEPLRIKPSGVQPIQAGVYEDFGHMEGIMSLLGHGSPSSDARRRPFTSRPGSAVSYPRNEHMPSVYTPTPLPELISGQAITRHQDVMERFSLVVKDLEAILLQVPIPSLSSLPPNHEIRGLVRQILNLAADSTERQRTPLLMSQKIVQYLYKTPTQLGREIYAALLENLCTSFEEVAKEAITWLIYADDERKYNVPVMATLLRTGLVPILQQDQQLAKTLYTDPRPNLLNFAAELIRECLSADPPIASQTQFVYTLEVLSQLSQANKATDE